MKVLFLNATNVNFESNGEHIEGTSLKFIERIPPKNGSPELFAPGKQWIKPECTPLVNIANSLVPGELIELVYGLDGKKVIFTGIEPYGEVVVDFNKIFNEGGEF